MPMTFLEAMLASQELLDHLMKFKDATAEPAASFLQHRQI